MAMELISPQSGEMFRHRSPLLFSPDMSQMPGFYKHCMPTARALPPLDWFHGDCRIVRSSNYYIGVSVFTIHGIPNRSTHIPKPGDQNV
jgi:hypothetical protein